MLMCRFVAYLCLHRLDVNTFHTCNIKVCFYCLILRYHISVNVYYRKKLFSQTIVFRRNIKHSFKNTCTDVVHQSIIVQNVTGVLSIFFTCNYLQIFYLL